MPEQTNNKNHDAEVEDREAEMNRTLFLRAFDEKTTEDELYELFLQVRYKLHLHWQSLTLGL